MCQRTIFGPRHRPCRGRAGRARSTPAAFNAHRRAGRVFGVTNLDDTVDAYSLGAGPTLATHAGPLAINGAYRFGYTKVNDHSLPGPADDFESSTAHASLAASVAGHAGRGLPLAGRSRRLFQRVVERRFVNAGAPSRGDVVVPVGPTLALTAGVGYERIRSSQRDFVRDAAGVHPGTDGQPQADPNAPRQLTYDMDGVMYDGIICGRRRAPNCRPVPAIVMAAPPISERSHQISGILPSTSRFTIP
jgi:hypothetical protein